MKLNLAGIACGLGLALLSAQPAMAVVYDGPDGGDWNTATNWSTDMVPGSGVDPEAAIIGDVTGTNAVTVNLAAEPTIAQIGDLRIGNGAAGEGTFNHSSGNIAPRVDKWSFIGVDGNGLLPAVGTYNLSGDASYTNFNATTGPFNSNEGNFFIGIGGGRRDFEDPLNSARNEGTLNISDDATFVAGNFFVGNNDDNMGTVNQTGGTVVAENWISVGRETGAIGEYNISSGSIAVTNDGITVGESTGATGTMNVSGDAQINAGRLRVGRSLATSPEDGGGTGYFNITGDQAMIEVGFLDVGANDGVLTNGDGTLSFTSASSVSPINVLTDVTLNDGSVEGSANLLVDLETSPPAAGDILLVDVGGTLTGTFAGLAEGAMVPNSGGRTITYMGGDGNDIYLLGEGGGGDLMADFNGDGTVDLLDLDILGNNFGLDPATMADGDANGDGVVDLLDLDILGNEFGMSSPASSIPEPTALLLGALAMGGLSLRRRV